MAIEFTPESVLIEMGLIRKGDIYALKAMCQRRMKPSTGDPERETRKRQLVEEIWKERESRGKKKFPRAGSADDTLKMEKASRKTRRISLGLMQFNKKKNKYVKCTIFKRWWHSFSRCAFDHDEN